MKFTTIKNAIAETRLSYIGRINASAKMEKNKKIGHYTYAIYLAPAKQSGYNVCSHSTPECRLGCLASSGRAGMELSAGIDRIKNARIKKTKLFFEEQSFFMDWVIAEMKYYQKKAIKDGYSFSARLNGTSDIDWANVLVDGKNIFEIFPDVQFYDYTKNPNKFNNKIPNYHLTFSYTGRNADLSLKLLESGNNVAVVFSTKRNGVLPEVFNSYPVIDGDVSDARFLDEKLLNETKGSVIGLRFKYIADKKAQDKILNSVFVVK